MPWNTPVPRHMRWPSQIVGQNRRTEEALKRVHCLNRMEFLGHARCPRHIRFQDQDRRQDAFRGPRAECVRRI